MMLVEGPGAGHERTFADATQFASTLRSASSPAGYIRPGPGVWASCRLGRLHSFEEPAASRKPRGNAGGQNAATKGHRWTTWWTNHFWTGS